MIMQEGGGGDYIHITEDLGLFLSTADYPIIALLSDYACTNFLKSYMHNRTTNQLCKIIPL
jgi:hypothetical protein